MKQHLESLRFDLIKFLESLDYSKKDIAEVLSISVKEINSFSKEISNRPVRWTSKLSIKLEPKIKKGFIYFLQTDDEKGFIKIGFTEHKSSIRVSSVKTSCPYPLKLLLIISGTLSDEQTIHKNFEEDRIRKNGEWFKPSAKLLMHIKNLTFLEK